MCLFGQDKPSSNGAYRLCVTSARFKRVDFAKNARVESYDDKINAFYGTPLQRWRACNSK